MGKTILIVILLVAIVALLVVLARLLREERKSLSEGLSAKDKGANGSGQRRHWLIGLSGDAEGKTFHIGSRSVTIGRAASNFVQISHVDASRVHCQLVARADKLEVTDMQSRNKTMVNNEPIAQKILRDGDLLTVANCIFEYKEVGEFAQNDAFSRKNVDSSSVRPTLIGQDDQPIEQIVIRALEKTSGDVIKAAQLTRLRVDIVEKYAKK